MTGYIDISRLQESADQLIEQIRQEMENQGINASGNLASSLQWVIDTTGGISFKVLADSYWDYAMKGRGPGKVPGNFKEILKQWINAKGIQFSGTIDQFAGAIMYTIRNFGSRRYRDNDPADVLTIPIDQFLNNAGDMFDEDEIRERIMS